MSSIGYGVHRVFEPNMEQRDLKANKPNLGLIFNKRAEISSQFRLSSRQTTISVLYWIGYISQYAGSISLRKGCLLSIFQYQQSTRSIRD